MAALLKLPVGIEDFREIRRLGFYYIDKTKLIEQLKAGTKDSDKLQEKITAYLEQLKDELAEFISECEEDGELEEKIDTLTEALDALEDAYEIISECE